MYPDKEPTKPVCPDIDAAACAGTSGTLPECAPLAVPYVPFQQESPKRYSQSDALNNGTLFPSLNLPFHVKVSGGNVSGPLGELQALEFVLVELALYLDTHKDDAEAFALFQQYAALEKEGREKYEAMYGPVTLFSAASGKNWSGWVGDPWPWDYPEGGKK